MAVGKQTLERCKQLFLSGRSLFSLLFLLPASRLKPYFRFCCFLLNSIGIRYAMKCLDKKRIKLKQGETLALNERTMLSLVSTGVRVTNRCG